MSASKPTERETQPKATGKVSPERIEATRQAQGLTSREAEVLALAVIGDANKEIAAKLALSPRTVEVHVAAVVRKCGMQSRLRLIAWYWSGP